MLSLASIGQCRFFAKGRPVTGPQPSSRYPSTPSGVTARVGCIVQPVLAHVAQGAPVRRCAAERYSPPRRLSCTHSDHGGIRSRLHSRVASTPPVNPRLRAPTADPPPPGPRPAPTGHRNAGAGLRPQPFRHSHQPSGSTASQLRPNRNPARRRLRYPCSPIICTNSTSQSVTRSCNGQPSSTFHCRLATAGSPRPQCPTVLCVLGQLKPAHH